MGELKVLESKLRGVEGELFRFVGKILESIGDEFIRSSSSSYGVTDTEVSNGLLKDAGFELEPETGFISSLPGVSILLLE